MTADVKIRVEEKQLKIDQIGLNQLGHDWKVRVQTIEAFVHFELTPFGNSCAKLILSLKPVIHGNNW